MAELDPVAVPEPEPGPGPTPAPRRRAGRASAPGQNAAARSPRAAARVDRASAEVPVVEAKLAPPRLRRDLLPRRDLVARLRGLHEERVVAIVAPAGYGKSTVLGLWLAGETRPVAWVTLDAADADPVRLFAHVAVAIDRAVGLDPSVLAALRSPGASVLGTVLPRLTSSLHRTGDPLVLVLDDVHAITGTASVDAVAMLLDYLPAGVTTAVAGRSGAGLPLARHRARGELLELTVGDLALDRRESVELARREGRRLTAAEADDLQARTEGWPAAVYLAVRAHAPEIPASTAPPAPGRSVAAFVDAELLAGATPETRRFLLQTSILDELTADLCDAVTGRRGSGRTLRELAERNLLVARLDATGEWYRYHALLREHLLARLDERPDERAALHRRAATWHAAHGHADAAIEHSVAAGDVDAAAVTATGAALATFRGGGAAMMARWIGHLDDAGLRRHPYLALVAAWAAALGGRPVEAGKMADIAEEAAYDDGPPAGAESFETARAALRALMARRGIEAARADAEWAVTHEPPGGAWRAPCLSVLGSLLAAVGDDDRAEPVLRECAETAEGTTAHRAFVSAQSWLAALAIERGDWLAAARLLATVDEVAARYGREQDATSAVAASVAARVALSHADVREATRRMAAFQRMRPALGPGTPVLSVRALLEAAHAYLALGDPAGARSALLQAEEILARRAGLEPLLGQVAALRARLRGLPPGPGGASTLTPAELRVLGLLPTYLTVPEIAERLIVAPNTVKTQVQSVYGKLGATSRAEAVERAIEFGLLEPLPALARDGITRT